jgi:putative flippase GtrA
VTRAARFVGVGMAGFAVQALMLHVLAAVGVPYLLATAVAVEGAILHNFLWHERWTWADRVVGRSRLTRFIRFNGSTALISIGGNVALMGVLVEALHFPLLAANLLTVLALSAVNFISADRLVFATKLTSRHNDPTPM